MFGSARGGMLEELLIISGLLGVQVVYAVYMILLNYVLEMGVHPLFLVIFGGLTQAVFLLPFAVAFEKKRWPRKLSLTLVVQLVASAMAGMALFQVLMLQGIKKTSAAMASAMPNLAPGLIFIFAACLRYEKFDAKCWFSRAKVMGTMVCLTGAISMSFLQNPSSSPAVLTSHWPLIDLIAKPLSMNSASEWTRGCLFLLVAVVFLSGNSVLQAAIMLKFPAPMSLCLTTSAMGSLFTAIIQYVMEGKINVGPSTISIPAITAIVLLGGVMVGSCVAFQTWCVNRKGPVLVGIFNPVQTVCSVILSAILFRQAISFGSLAGMVLMFAGLYMVLWAKNNECFSMPNHNADTEVPVTGDIEKPLLS